MVKKLREITTGKANREETSKSTPDRAEKNSAVTKPISPAVLATNASPTRWEDQVDYEEASDFGEVPKEVPSEESAAESSDSEREIVEPRERVVEPQILFARERELLERQLAFGFEKDQIADLESDLRRLYESSGATPAKVKADRVRMRTKLLAVIEKERLAQATDRDVSRSGAAE